MRGIYPSHVFETNVSIVYEQTDFWKKKLFLLLSGKAAIQLQQYNYNDKTTKLMYEWLQDSPLKDIAFKAIMIMSSLLLQKPSKNSKSKDHLKLLERCIKLWTSGDLLDLLKEAKIIQKELRIQKDIYKYNGDIQKVFTRNEKRKSQQRYEIPIRRY